MFDIGGWEFLIIVVLAIVIIGPKDLPGAIRGVTLWVRKARGLARDFQSGLDEIAHEAELDKLQQEVRTSIDGAGVQDAGNSIRKEIEEAVDPDDEIRKAFTDEDHYLDDPSADPDGAEDVIDDEDIRRRAEAERDRREAAEKTAAASEPGSTDKPDDGAPAGDPVPPARAGTRS